MPTWSLSTLTKKVSYLITQVSQLARRLTDVENNPPSGGGGVTDGTKGDIAVSGSGTIYTVRNGTINTAKMGGDVTTAGKNLLTSIDVSTQRTVLGLESAALRPAPAGTIVGTTDAQTLTNKTLTNPVISTVNNGGTITFPVGTDTLVGRATTDTLTNKTISGATNTISNIAQASVTNLVSDLNGKVPTTRTISTGNGITGGGDLSANRTLALDIVNLATDATPDDAADYVVTYDSSAMAHKKVLLSNLPTGVGGGGVSVTGGNIASLAALVDAEGTFADAISSLGSTPTTVMLDEDTTISTPHTIPANVTFLQINKSKFIKSGTGTLTFQGIGLYDPLSTDAVFQNFAAGQVTWTGTAVGTYPTAISTELWNTGDNSESTRAIRATAALALQSGIWIQVHARTQTDSVTLNEGHSVLMMSGEHLSTYVQADPFLDYAPWIMNSNSEFTSQPGAIVYEPSVDNSNMIVHTVEGAENVRIHHNYFKGVEGTLFDGANTGVGLVSAFNSHIEYNRFDTCHSYNASFLNNVAEASYCRNCTIRGNVITGFMTQLIAFTAGSNCAVVDNIIDCRDLQIDVACSVIDFEPNEPDAFCEDIEISRNLIDLRNLRDADGLTDGYSIIAGIHVQATHTHGVRRLRVNNNTILFNDISGDQLGNKQNGIKIDGADFFEVHDNLIQGCDDGAGIQTTQCRRGSIKRNRIANGNCVISLSSTAETYIEDNIAIETPESGANQAAYINEGQFRHPLASTTGSDALLAYDIFGNGGTNMGRVYQHYIGLKGMLNALEKTVDSIAHNGSYWTITYTSAVGTLATQTITSADVNSAGDFISETAHGWNTGACVHYISTGTALAGLTNGGFYYIIRASANTYKLADTYHLALAGTARDLTSAAGSGTHTIYPVWETKFMDNFFAGNRGFESIDLDSFSTSEIYEPETPAVRICNKVRLYPPDFALGGFYASNGIVKGSNTSFTADLVTLGTFGTTTQFEWNEITFDNATEYKYLVIEGNNGGTFAIGEIEFLRNNTVIDYVSLYESSNNGASPVDNAFNGDEGVSAWVSGGSGGGTIGIQVRGENDNVNLQSGTTYTLKALDLGNEIRYTNAGTKNVTVQPTSILGTDHYSEHLNVGAGVLTFVAGTGVTLRNHTSTLAQYKRAKIEAVGTNEYVISYFS